MVCFALLVCKNSVTKIVTAITTAITISAITIGKSCQKFQTKPIYSFKSIIISELPISDR